MGYPVAARNSFLDAHITGALTVALYTSAPNDEGVGGTEVTDGSYARVSHSSWNAAAAGVLTNNGIIDFGDPTADWGTIVAAGVWDGATFKGVSTAFSTAVGSSATSVTIASGALSFNFS